MKGKNELILNEATMIEAVQFWLASQMPEAPRVVSVANDRSVSNTFRIIFMSDTDGEPA